MKRCWKLSKLSLSLLIVLASSPVPDAAAAPKQKHGRDYYEARGDIVWEMPTEEKIIALTFDDGPDPDNTAAILDVLKQYKAKATFFLIGEKVMRNPELVEREAKEGHELANHTYRHSYWRSDAYGKVEKEIVQTEDAIWKVAGKRCRLFRPPGGMFNDRLVTIAREHGYLVVMWSWHQDTKDWSRPGVNKIVARVLDNVRNGDIVLFHDYVEKGSQTIDALKIILPELQRRGYRFVTVSDMLISGKTNPLLQPRG